ncbi:DUF960 family protein [Clostridium beijerinckii]|uniref:DUF960 domain-containing protein n=1 Tax=Clostridium beijerinckii TaxID=1520 RepID=A0A7X9ST38_CLOBE|nr:DUF960 family protein [Clostridium beijerinckii]NMF07318.1 DUF960 domain-containing protein [Clostridium beijerinckii]
MFNKEKRYISRQANEIVPVEIQILMWNMVDELKSKMELDYLQIFRLKKKEDKVIIDHEQEVPPYKEQYELKQSNVSIEHDIKIYVIDSIDYSTMIWAEEY